MATDAIPDDVQQQLEQFEQLRQQAQALAQQQSQVEIAMRETERTLEELDEVAADTPLYRASGAIMVRVDDLKKLKSDLKEEQERHELRTKTLKTQIDKLNTQLQEMQTRLTPVLQRLQGPGGPGAGS
jgi:prefoldin beta subunit